VFGGGWGCLALLAELRGVWLELTDDLLGSLLALRRSVSLRRGSLELFARLSHSLSRWWHSFDWVALFLVFFFWGL